MFSVRYFLYCIFREIPYFGVPAGYISAFIIVVYMHTKFSVKRYLNIKLSVLFVYNNFVHQHSEMCVAYRAVGYNTVKQFYAFFHLFFALFYGVFNIIHLTNSALNRFYIWMYTKKVDKCVRIRDKKKTERKSTHV